MKYGLLGAALLLGTWGGLHRIHDRNEAVRRGAAAYARQQYAAAAQAYKQAALQFGAQDEGVWLNLAHATVRAGHPAEARTYYGHLLESANPAVRSVALQQLANLAAAKPDYAQAIGHLRQALLANPRNADARHNYEALLDFMAQQRQRPQSPPPGTDGSPDQESASASSDQAGTARPGQLPDPSRPQDPRQAPQARPDANGPRPPGSPAPQPGTQAPGFQPGSGAQRAVARGQQPGTVLGLSDEETGREAPGTASRRGGTELAAPDEANLQTQRARLEQMNLSTGQARQVLEALQAAEQQYLQQLPRKATKPRDKDKPTW